jgi:hypothetical protein
MKKVSVHVQSHIKPKKSSPGIGLFNYYSTRISSIIIQPGSLQLSFNQKKLKIFLAHWKIREND